MPRQSLTFFRNGNKVSLAEFPPDITLLDYLRLKEKKTGTKEGCNEGDCGACTVVLGKIRNGKLTYEPVNSCIQLLGQVDSTDVITVDDLKEGEKLHRVQQSMVTNHASQCGFCTPGFVMSLFAYHHSDEKASRNAVNDYLAGNLCRCTGYRPIADAAIESRTRKPTDALSKRIEGTQKDLERLQADGDVFVGNKDCFFAAPASIRSLLILAKRHKDATIIAGATDVGLWITKKLQKIDKVIYVGRVSGFDKISKTKSKLEIGAGSTYLDAFDALCEISPDICEVLRRLGSRQVRASGTVGGNIANGSPIGDMPPMLIALDAKIELARENAVRSLALEKFFLAYGKQDLKSGELVTKISIPKLRRNEIFKAWKISKRFDQDISALLFASKFELEEEKIKAARIAFGGMAETPKRAIHVERSIVGLRLDDVGSIENCLSALERDFTPISDMRASASYRMQVAKNLLRKAILEIQSGKLSGTRILPEEQL